VRKSRSFSVRSSSVVAIPWKRKKKLSRASGKKKKKEGSSEEERERNLKAAARSL
jgi:hypothetical protein